MYKVINETHIQKMPDAENFTTRGPHDQLDFDGASYEDAYKNLPEPILRGDNGQWKQDQVLQDDEVEFYCKHCSDLLNDKIEVFCSGTKENPCGSVAVPAKLYDEDEDDLAQAVMEYRRDHPEPKPKPIETLFKEAMEKEAEDQCFDAQEDRIFLRGAQTAFNYLLTNKMIK